MKREIMLYIFDELNKLTDSFSERFLQLSSSPTSLSEERRIKVQKLRSSESKKQSVVAYLLLRIALLTECAIDEPVEFGYIDNGKPILPKYPQIHFNLSHCKTAVACALSPAPIGVDIQHITTVSERVANRVLTPDELTAYQNARNPDEYFCKIWAIKESFVKISGKGLRTDFRSLSADSVPNKIIHEGKNYFCCVCGDSVNEENMHLKMIRSEDFEQFARQ